MADLQITADYSELVGLIKTTDQTKQAIKLMGAEFARTGNQSAYLKGINQLVAAQTKLPSALRMSRSEVMALGNAYKQQTAFTDAFTQAQIRSNKGLARGSVAMQQFGYQAGDFIVQVQSGTNAFVAFGQQATQLAGLLTMSLNPKIVGLGVALSIVIPLTTAFAAAWMRTRETGEDATSEIENVDEALKEYQRTLEASARGMTLEELFSVNELERAQRQLESLQQDLQSVVELNPFAIMSEGLRDALKRFTFGLADFTLPQLIEDAEAAVVAAEERIAALRKKQDEEAAQRRREYAMETETDLRNEIQIMQIQLQHGEDSLEVEKARAEQARQAFLLEVMREGIYGEQLQRLTELYDKQAELNSIMNMPVFGPEDPRGQGTGGGTTGGGSAVQEGVGGVARSLLTDVEQLQLEFEERRAAIEEFNAIEIELFGSKNEAIRRLEEEHQAAMREIQNTQEQQRLKNTSSFMGSLAAITKAGGEKTFKLYQGFAIAQSLIDSYAAFTAVLRDPTFVGRPWARAAAAGAVLAQGLAQVQNIRGVTSSGGGGGAAGGGAVAAPVAAAAPEPQQVIIEGIDRDSLISGEQLSKLFDRLYEENDERGIVFSVAR